MNILAFDTVTESLSIAVATDRGCDGQQLHPGVGHSRMLLPEIDRLLERNDLRIEDIDLIAVGTGPGSFTGVRIGVAAAQAIAFASNTPVIGVSSLAAMAYAPIADADESVQNSDRVLAVIDARMGEMYAGFYEITSEDLQAVTSSGQELVVAAADLRLPDGDASVSQFAGWQSGDYTMVVATAQDAAREFVNSLTMSRPSRLLHGVYPSASALVKIARARFCAGEPADPMALVPSYVRNRVASVARQR